MNKNIVELEDLLGEKIKNLERVIFEIAILQAQPFSTDEILEMLLDEEYYLNIAIDEIVDEIRGFYYYEYYGENDE